MLKTGFIGIGNMGSALARAVKKSERTELCLSSHSPMRAEALSKELCARVCDNRELSSLCDFVFIGVKPNMLEEVILEIRESLRENHNSVLVSMVAGATLSGIEGLLGFSMPIIRIMPNTPVAVGKGITLFSANNRVGESQKQSFVEIMSASGMLDEVSEDKMDMATAITGCGPAFAYMFIEALADGGVYCGLPRKKAEKYAAQMLLGAAERLLSDGGCPEALKDEVCSPAGSTIEGVHSLEEGAFRRAVQNAVIASYKKTLEMKK